MADRQAAEARLIPVGAHECVTCERCACTFAAVHPACPRCAAAGVEIVSNADALSVRLAQAEQERDEARESKSRIHRRAQLAEKRAERAEEALKEIVTRRYWNTGETEARSPQEFARAFLSTQGRET